MSGKSVLILGGLIFCAALWARDDQISFWPQGPAAGMITRAHPLRPNKFMLVRWERDRAFDEQGWCVWAALPGEPPRYHLVIRADGETINGTRDEWWKR